MDDPTVLNAAINEYVEIIREQRKEIEQFKTKWHYPRYCTNSGTKLFFFYCRSCKAWHLPFRMIVGVE